MALTYGVEGVRQKDYKVYIHEWDATLQALIDTYLAQNGQTKTNLNAILTHIGSELGECRSDSIELTIDKGDTVDGNNLGEIVLNKACSFTAELLNATPSNISALEAMDGVNVSVVLLEKDTHLLSGAPYKTAILLNNFVMSYGEKITGKDSIRSTVTIGRNVPTAGSFRHIADIDWS